MGLNLDLVVPAAQQATKDAPISIKPVEPTNPPAPPSEPPPPISYIDVSIVDIASLTPNHTLRGSGIVVRRSGRAFVVTSKSLFAYGVGAITINDKPASVLLHDHIWGLTALYIYDDVPLPPDIAIAENLPAGSEVTLGNQTATIDEYLRRQRHWMVVSPPPEPCIGKPLIQDEEVVGLILGRNRIDETTVIAVDATQLDAFITKVVVRWPEK
jgi:hypothetical protein